MSTRQITRACVLHQRTYSCIISLPPTPNKGSKTRKMKRNRIRKNSATGTFHSAACRWYIILQYFLRPCEKESARGFPFWTRERGEPRKVFHPVLVVLIPVHTTNETQDSNTNEKHKSDQEEENPILMRWGIHLCVFILAAFDLWGSRAYARKKFCIDADSGLFGLKLFPCLLCDHFRP